MIDIYDDTNESTIPLDLKTSRWLILLNTAACLVVVILGFFNGEKFFQTSTVYGVSSYTISGFISVGLYFLMYRVQRYPTIYAALSFLSLGLATYVSGFDIKMGITFSIIAIGYIIIYLTLVKLYNIDDPEKNERTD